MLNVGNITHGTERTKSTLTPTSLFLRETSQFLESNLTARRNNSNEIYMYRQYKEISKF